jgi:hypothetical protein
VDDAVGHGTCMASLAAGAYAGTNKYASIIPVRIFDSVTREGSAAHILDAFGAILDLLSTTGFRDSSVVSMSFGVIPEAFKVVAGQELGKADPFADLLARLEEAGAVCVIAAGNHLPNTNANFRTDYFTPARHGGVNTKRIVVGAVDSWHEVAPFSPTIDPGGILSIYAPGVQVPCASAGSGNGYKLDSGTSDATAMVSGLVSQLLVSGRATAATAKASLIAISVARKGFFVNGVPRAAQYVEMACDDENAPQVVIPTFVPYPSPLFQVDIDNHIGTSVGAENADEVSALRLFTTFFFLSAIFASCNSFCSDLRLLIGIYPKAPCVRQGPV